MRFFAASLTFVVLACFAPAPPAGALCVSGVLCPTDPTVPPDPDPEPAPAPGGDPEPRQEPGPGPRPEPSEYRVVEDASLRLLGLVNDSRAAANRSQLTARADLIELATAHADRMARTGDIFHNDELFTASAKRRAGAARIGENVAVNTTVEDAHRRLMASDGHRANIVDDRFTTVGVGVVRHPDGRIFITEVFVEPHVAPPPAAPAPGQPEASVATVRPAEPAPVEAAPASSPPAELDDPPTQESPAPSELAFGRGQPTDTARPDGAVARRAVLVAAAAALIALALLLAGRVERVRPRR